MTTQNVYYNPFNTLRNFLGWMIFECDWNSGLFVARSRGPKKRSGGGRQSPEIGIRRIAKIFIQ